MVDSGSIRLPTAIDMKARQDFTRFVITTPPPPRESDRLARKPAKPSAAVDL